MKTNVENLGAGNFKLTITAEEADLKPLKQQVLQHMAKDVRLPGFRPGKAPLNMVEKQLDPQAYQEHFLNDALNSLYSQAIRSNKLRVVGEPKVNLAKFVPFTTLEFSAEVEAIGKITLPDWRKIQLAKPAVSVSAQDVNAVIESLRQRMAKRTPSQKPAQKGDEVIIDFTGKDKSGKPLSGASGQKHPLVLGSKAFVPGFEEALVGTKAGQEKTFKVTFPADYGVSALRNQLVEFTANVVEVNAIQLPELNDQFAAQAGPVKTVAELKEDIKKQLALERQRQVDREFENQIVRQITAQSQMDLPSRLIDEQVLALEQDEKRNLVYRGQTWQEHLKEEGINEEEHRLRHRPQAEEQVRGGLVLTEIAEQEGITITPEELEIRIQVLKGQYQDKAMQAELDKPENRQDIASRLLTEKTLAKLVEYTKK